MKICSKCKAEKPKAEFSPSKQKKDGMHQYCKPCRAICAAAWRASNPEKVKALNSASYSAHAELRSAYRAEYRATYPDKVKASSAEYNAKNRDKIKADSAAWRLSNPDRQKANNAAWRAANPEKRAAHHRNRRARLNNADGTHNAEDVKDILERQRGLCANCHAKLFKSGRNKFHTDHIIPIALGGSNWPANLQCLCPSCNLSKGAKHPDEWAKLNGKLL